MSYSVVILRSPVPDEDAAAWSAMFAVAEAMPEGEVPPVFLQLIDRLTERYPCICDLSDDEVDDGAWSDGPLRDNATHAVTILGLASPRVEEVQPFVVQTANELDLVVFDEQLGAIYRPGRAATFYTPCPVKKPWWKFWA